MTKSLQAMNVHVTLPDSLYAHSRRDSLLEHWQRLDVHLNNVAALASDFGCAFDSADWARMAGLLHDFGKAANEFQAYLRRENHIDDKAYDGAGFGRVNHSSAGAWLAEEWYNKPGLPFGRVLSYVVAGHHAGLPDYDESDGGLGALRVRLQEGRANLDNIVNLGEELKVWRCDLNALPAFVKKDNMHFWIRMLFSCLTDADFLDTEGFMEPELGQTRLRECCLRRLKIALDEHLKIKSETCGATPVNAIRREILTACRLAAEEDPGLFSLTVPTGGGKTLSAMAFALDHAICHNKRRVIYVIPYTSIIEQTAAILVSIFGNDSVVEHHCNIDPAEETIRTRLASENWDAPIIVTTNVQFFESLFSAKSSRCRKLHNLVDSVVIFDEAQLVPPTKLEPCVAAINELTRNYGVTVLLSTATQPRLPGLQQAREIIPESCNLYGRLRRVKIHKMDIPETVDGSAGWEVISAQLQNYRQLLCIVNTRRDCYELYKLMPDGTIHLSALMCGEHRASIIRRIKELLSLGESVRVISTQLVEAGVDLDFPVVYRALAGLDSIAQAAGRCNREGLLTEKGQVVVFASPRSLPPGVLRKAESTTRELWRSTGYDPLSTASFARYCELFYGKLNDTGNEFVDKLIPSDTTLIDIAFRTVGETFRVVDDKDQCSVLVRYQAGEELIEELRERGPYRELMRRLQRFSVNLHSRQVEQMIGDGLLEEVWPGFLAQCSASLYSEAVGLDVYRCRIPAEDLII